MPGVKTTILLDEKVWAGFRDYVLARYGNKRRLSIGVEEALAGFSPPYILGSLTERLKLKVDLYPSSGEIKARRRRVRLSAGRTIRKMRDARQESISRL